MLLVHSFLLVDNKYIQKYIFVKWQKIFALCLFVCAKICWMTNFPDWLQTQLDERGWKPADLARAGRIDNAIISRALKGERMPSVESLTRIAKAFKMPVEIVLRAAKALPPKSLHDELVEQATYLFEQIETEEGKKAALSVLESLASKKGKKNRSGVEVSATRA